MPIVIRFGAHKIANLVAVVEQAGCVRSLDKDEFNKFRKEQVARYRAMKESKIGERM